jgi:hypothetical protein
MKNTTFTCDRCGTVGQSQTDGATLSIPQPSDDWGTVYYRSKQVDLCPDCAHDFKAVFKRFLADKPVVT